MSWNYNPNLIAAIDQVRIAIGDVTTSDPLFSDQEITGMLAVYPSALLAAAALADAQAAKYARRASMSVDGLSVQYNQRVTGFMQLASRLRAQAANGEGAGNVGSPLISGISKADMETQKEDTDRDPNRFEVGMQDYPGTPRLPYGDRSPTDGSP